MSLAHKNLSKDPAAKRKRSVPVSLPYQIERRRVYILPTRFGLIFMLALLLMLIGSVNYKNNLGFLLTFLLVSMTLISVFFTYKNLVHIVVKAWEAEPVFAGRTAGFMLLVEADSDRRAIRFSFSGQPIKESDLLAAKSHWIKIDCQARERGILRPGPLTVASGFPFGLFRAWSRLDIDFECLVYPRPVSGPLLITRQAGGQIENGTQKIPGVDDFEGLRRYQPGDSPRRISWKAYSRGQGLLTKAFSAAAGGSALFDWRQIPERDIEKKLSRLCGMVLQGDHLQMEYGLRFPHQEIAAGKGIAHRNHCLKALAVYGLAGDFGEN